MNRWIPRSDLRTEHFKGPFLLQEKLFQMIIGHAACDKHFDNGKIDVTCSALRELYHNRGSLWAFHKRSTQNKMRSIYKGISVISKF